VLLRAPNRICPKRDESLLQAATPILISISAAARGQNREGGNSTMQDIGAHSVRNTPPELTHAGK
jgi:hypothetical protein